ncbi:protoglobin domain-containing protein [Pectobacterium sp. IFB5596]|uniref:protoglobin domain-containing protein n=1 Tax=Pectobacterium sp. IFB5596 TaxID=1839803 RepID=UPI001F25E056|nr:protoglobin domain-containing protein [Pectobacterium sp. IFB5596]GKW10626.1 hypothetical protein PEC301899_09080 [Pectobacterium carotovorum subsp. carotovorum]
MNELLNVNEQRDNGESDYNQVVTSEWTQLIATTSQKSFGLLQALAAQKASEFADKFYSYMLKDQEASLFLSSQQVHDRLHGSMSKWIVDILSNTGDHLADLILYQKKIGQIHARIGIPIWLNVEPGV